MNLKVSIFSNAGTVPIEIANREGFFAQHGLSVDIEPTTSSIQQMTGLIDGRYHIAATAIDNVIAYNCGQGAAPTENRSELKVFLGSATYTLPLVVAPHISTFSDLKGSTIAVDAIDTGFAFLLREMLEMNGLSPETYDFRSIGAPKERWLALKSNVADAALLNAHFEAQAHQQKYKTLLSDPNPWDNYQGNTFCAGREFLNDGPVEAFTSAMLQSVEFTKNPINATVVAAALTHHLGDLEPQAALDVANSLQGKQSILIDGLPVSRSGIATVLHLREKYTSTELNLTVEDLCDPRTTIAM
ncbi:MAG: ABC transporter substrate-binding protein [Gammaproteobacteria bacterium]|nr:ABC transporter substrate-binding protein [Gammaproteobacteria bacterium]